MSTLRTNALEGVDAKNSITIVAGAGNITTTNVQEGLAKCSLRADMNTENTIEDSFNTASISDDGTGNTSWNFTNAFGNLHGIMSGATTRTANSKLSGGAGNIAVTTSQFIVRTTAAGSDSAADTEWGALAHGDLA